MSWIASQSNNRDRHCSDLAHLNQSENFTSRFLDGKAWEINERIHHELQSSGRVEERQHRLTVLLPRQEMTGAGRQRAAQYGAGDIVR